MLAEAMDVGLHVSGTRGQAAFYPSTLQIGYTCCIEIGYLVQIYGTLQPNTSLQVLLLFIDLLMDAYVDLCLSFGLPVWIASLLHTAKRLRFDHARRKKVYRLLQRKLMFHRVGVKEDSQRQPTYVYPEEVKLLMRSAFPKDICDYPDPDHDHVVYITVEDLYNIENN
ncbi:hypothetical protein CRENBAI_020346 [Crenichthys baileyi]|uniref:Uncharacterized protein n=1 Tax=Crenichthys baileyi TaxID=28760 RepID=A0AAV9R5Q4_9TELE